MDMKCTFIDEERLVLNIGWYKLSIGFGGKKVQNGKFIKAQQQIILITT